MIRAPAPAAVKPRRIALALVLSIWVGCAHAATREEDLAALRARIEALKGELEEREASRREARDALRESERSISDTNRGLRQLEAEGRAVQEGLAKLAARRADLEQAAAGQRAALGRLLAARYASGAPDALRLALSGEDPNDVTRKLYYLGHLSAAAARLIESFSLGMRDLERLRREAQDNATRLEAIEAAKRADREKILSERRERQRVLERVAAEVRAQRTEIKVLVADENRLARLVQEISRVLTARPGAGFARPDPSPESGVRQIPFSELRGKLRLPVQGELAGQTGAARQSGAGRKGLFIRAKEGQPVRAVAAGLVVFADWMRGFGNLLIVDHGESYLSIYGNNEALLKQAGQPVSAGETLATVGASGGSDESGLYFELRHLGMAFDPLRWVGRR